MNNETSDLSRFNQIPYRLESIKKMVDNNILDSMIDFNNKNDEYFFSQSHSLSKVLIPRSKGGNSRDI
jgi:hypothetical protein